MENLLKNIEELRENILKTIKFLDIDRLRERAVELGVEINKPDFWNNHKKAVIISREKEELEKEVKIWDDILHKVRELEELVAIGKQEQDDSIKEEAYRRYKELKAEFKKQEFLILFDGKYDKNNSIISIHAGTGGVDAQDWAQMLERMIIKFSEKKGWKVEILDRNMGSEAGIKNVTLKISGRWSYGYLKSENGVHRLVRISPFDAESMRHTSFALVEVIPELPESDEIKIKDEDLRIDVFRSSGPGGQGVNTTDSAVRIIHRPTNIVVTCQSERSQHQNKDTALRILKSKLLKMQHEQEEAKLLKIKGETQKAEWGKQIRSYVMQPYKMVKDHRTNYETQDIDSVLDGNLDEFIEAYLRWQKE